MGIKDLLGRFSAVGRRRKEPQRETLAFARLTNLGGIMSERAQIKPTPPNLRYFSRTPYARAAIRRIRDPLSSLDWMIQPAKGVKRNAVLDKQIAIASACIHHPNRDDNWRGFVGQVIEDWLVYGAGCFEQQVGNDPNRPLWMWPVDAQSIQIFAGWTGARDEARYIQTIGYTNVGFLEGRELRNDELVYIRANSSTETPYGFGPLEIAFNTINRQLGVAEFTGNLASNSQPQGVLHFEDADREKLLAIRNYWRNEVEGQGQTPIFGGKNKPTFTELHPGGDEALYLKYQDFVIREIATSFGLSPQNMGVEADVNRNTSEVAADRDWDNTIVPLAELISSYITREVLHSKLGFYQLEFAFDGLYREDEESAATIYETYYKNNLMTPNEQRAQLGLPPSKSEWADKCFADFQIAISAARGTQVIADPDLPGGVGGNTAENKSMEDQTVSDSQSIASFENN